jgi:hypothetical protein
MRKKVEVARRLPQGNHKAGTEKERGGGLQILHKAERSGGRSIHVVKLAHYAPEGRELKL